MSKIVRTNGSKDVTTAGTQLPLSATSVGFQELVIQAKSANTWSIYVWNSTVASTDWIALLKTEMLTLTGGDLNDVYVDCSVNWEWVTFLYIAS